MTPNEPLTYEQILQLRQTADGLSHIHQKLLRQMKAKKIRVFPPQREVIVMKA